MTVSDLFKQGSLPVSHLAVLILLFSVEIAAQNIQSTSKIAPAINGFTVKKDAVSIPYSRMLFGQFIEHFHSQIYGGIFDPGSPLSDKDGFRKDVIEALRELKVPIVRWPGGCFVSSYHWLDGTGAKRSPAYDKAWKVEEPNTFGTDEYIKWCRIIGAEPYICTNAGTGTPEEMSDWVEYCNLNIVRYGAMRRDNGHAEPYNVLYWSVGNENWGAIYVHPGGIVKRTTFYVFDLYANKLEKNVVPIEISSEILTSNIKSTPLVDAILTTNDSKTRYVLAVVNKSPDTAVTFRPDFAGMQLTTPGKVTGAVLNGSSPDDFNDVGAGNRVIPVNLQFQMTDGAITLLPHSLSVFPFE